MIADLALSLDAVKAAFAKNLVVARKTRGLTQAKLAEAAGVTRPTIALMEGGESDPHLSTVVNVATALETSPMFLLLGENELRAIVQVTADPPDKHISDADVEKARRLVKSGLVKKRLEAAAIGVSAEKAVGPVAVAAAIGTALIPGVGTAIGAAIGVLLMVQTKKKVDE